MSSYRNNSKNKEEDIEAGIPLVATKGGDNKLSSALNTLANDNDTMTASVEYVRAIIACTIYMLVGPTLILINKYILTDLGFSFPLTLAGLGVFCTAVCSRLIVYLGYATLDSSNAAYVEGKNYYTKVLPVGAGQAMTLAFGNAVYLYLGVSMIQMLKSFTPVVVMLMLMVLKVEFPNKGMILSVVGVVGGTLITTSSASGLSLVGLCIMFMAEASEGIRLSLVQFLLTNCKFGIVEGQYYLAPTAAFCLWGCAALLEWGEIVASGKYEIIFTFPQYFFYAGALGVAVNFLTFFVVQTVGGVMLKVLATVRNIGVVVYGAVVLNEIVTMQQYIGYMISMIGATMYNHYRGINNKK